MTNPRLRSTSHRVVRRAARVLAILPAIVVTGITAPALAAPPEQWEDTPSVAPFHALLILFLLPAGLFLVITLLVYLPSMRHSEGYQPGQVWRGEPEWFGGPRKGVEAIDETEPAAVGSGRDGGESGRGGASGHW